MEAALVSVGMGVMKPLLSKLSKLLEEEYANQKSMRRNTKFLRDEMGTMGATLQILSDSEEIDPQMRIWRDDVRELSYDMEDCVDDIMSRVEHDLDGPLGLKAIYDWFKKVKPRHEIGDKIKQLKTRASEASERHKRYKVFRSTADSSISAIDPRLPAFYEEVDNLVGIDGPKKHIIEWFKKEGSSAQLKVLSIAGPGGLGKTTLANQVFATIQSQFSCAAFVSVSRIPNMKKILRDIAKAVGITDNTSDDDVKQRIDRLREHLKMKGISLLLMMSGTQEHGKP